MADKKIYGPWIKWHGGKCPVPPDTMVNANTRNGTMLEPRRAGCFRWEHHNNGWDIVEYRTVTEQPDLEAAEQLLRANGYTITPPAKPLTFEDVVPMTEVPPAGTLYWVVDALENEGVYNRVSYISDIDFAAIKHRMAYLDKEHAIIAARHLFGLKGGEL